MPQTTVLLWCTKGIPTLANTYMTFGNISLIHSLNYKPNLVVIDKQKHILLSVDEFTQEDLNMCNLNPAMQKTFSYESYTVMEFLLQ